MMRHKNEKCCYWLKVKTNDNDNKSNGALFRWHKTICSSNTLQNLTLGDINTNLSRFLINFKTPHYLTTILSSPLWPRGSRTLGLYRTTQPHFTAQLALRSVRRGMSPVEEESVYQFPQYRHSFAVRRSGVEKEVSNRGGERGEQSRKFRERVLSRRIDTGPLRPSFREEDIGRLVEKGFHADTTYTYIMLLTIQRCNM